MSAGNLGRGGRVRGSKNLKTLESLRDKHAYRFQSILFQRLHTPTNERHFRSGVDKLCKNAGSGDVRSLEMLVRLHEAADRAVRDMVAGMALHGDLDVGSCTVDEVVAWTARRLPELAGTEAQDTFLELAESLLRMAVARQRRLDADSVPVGAVRELSAAFLGAVRDVLDRPDDVRQLTGAFLARVESSPALRLITGGNDAATEADTG